MNVFTTFLIIMFITALYKIFFCGKYDAYYRIHCLIEKKKCI